MGARHGERKKQVLDLQKAHPDWSYAELAEATGAHPATIRAICNRAGVSVRHAPTWSRPTAEQHRALAKYHLQRARELEAAKSR